MGGSWNGWVDLGSLLRVHSCCVVLGVVDMFYLSVGKGGPYGMKSMKGERREQFGDFIKRAENGDRQPDLTKYHYWNH